MNINYQMKEAHKVITEIETAEEVHKAFLDSVQFGNLPINLVPYTYMILDILFRHKEIINGN